MTTQPAHILHTIINVPYETAYAFAQVPQNFPRWAAGLSSSLHPVGDHYEADAPQGKAIVRFTPPNPHGVLDHWVQIEGAPGTIYIPLRMIPSSDGTLVELVLFRQPEMNDDAFEKDAVLVRNDLATLKSLLEEQTR